MDLSTQSLIYGRLVDHEAILVRADLPPGHLNVANPQTGQFSHFIRVPELGIALNRGWCSVDVFTRGERLRYVVSHPEQESVPLLNYVQIQELLGTLANVKLPVILAGDFNADPLHRNGTLSYDQFGAAGFKDAWTQLNPNNAAGGLTWGHDPLLADPAEAFSWRIDLVLCRGGTLNPSSLQVVDVITGRAQPPLWTSDHAAVAGSFVFAP